MLLKYFIEGFTSVFVKLFFFKIFFYCCSITVVSIFPLPLSLTPPTPTSHPHSFGFVHGSFIHVPGWLFHFFPSLLLSSLPSGYCQLVLYFNVSGYIYFMSSHSLMDKLNPIFFDGSSRIPKKTLEVTGRVVERLQSFIF